MAEGYNLLVTLPPSTSTRDEALNQGLGRRPRLRSAPVQVKARPVMQEKGGLMTKAQKKKREDVCCDRFYEAYVAKEISYAYEKHEEIDETEWFISGLWHLYYCPFCGASIKGCGFSETANPTK